MEETDRLLHELVDKLKAQGLIKSRSIEEAFRKIPRHLFLPGLPVEEVYADIAIPTKTFEGKPISSSSQPSMMAIMLEQLRLKTGQMVLEIGAGTGYNAALMDYLVGESGRVTTIDIDEDIVEQARQHLQVAGVEQVQVIQGDGGYGYPPNAPYDRIILTVGASDITPAWADQLLSGGRLVLPIRLKGRSQKSIAFHKERDIFRSLSIQDCGFMDLRGAFADASTRIFQLGGNPHLFLEIDEDLVIKPGSIYDWLTTGKFEDKLTDVTVSFSDIVGGLSLWLGLHDRRTGVLSAINEAAEDNFVPPLITFGEQSQTVFTFFVIGEGGLAVLTLPHDILVAENSSEGGRADIIFRLVVRQFGSDPEPARRLMDLVGSWAEAGKPTSKGMQVIACLKANPCYPKEGEIAIEKSSSIFLLSWPGAKKAAVNQ
jgi:protein-L-isoaspartate(D-aspartate) O-methyltransferase